MIYIDVFNIEHTNCKVVETQNEFKRVFIIEDPQGVRYTCLKKDAPALSHTSEHWEHASPSDSPDFHKEY